MERLRTPEERFANLADFPFGANYADVTDPTGAEPLRMAYLDEGRRDGDVVLLLHGEPTWSYLYRHVIPGLVASGYRVVVPDLIGFGRSDKPTPREEYTYARHVEWTRQLLFEHLDLRDVTLFGQDWGSLVGLRLVGEHPERFARVAIGNGGLPTGEERSTDAFFAWQTYSQTAPELPIGRIVSGGCVNKPLSEEITAAYDAPFPDETFKEGARQFPALVPTAPEDPAHDANVAAWAVLAGFTKPFLLCFSDGDAITRGGERRFKEKVPGASGQEHTTIVGAGHFLQEDQGPQLATVLATFIAAH
ncbi:MAG TPA: haloalkane dehalogenase [Acidimicrobiales bacterium]|nr:haloalkane dehalogenase [Acidimicrobiales bacterium]